MYEKPSSWKIAYLQKTVPSNDHLAPIITVSLSLTFVDWSAILRKLTVPIDLLEAGKATMGSTCEKSNTVSHSLSWLISSAFARHSCFVEITNYIIMFFKFTTSAILILNSLITDANSLFCHRIAINFSRVWEISLWWDGQHIESPYHFLPYPINVYLCLIYQFK